MARSPTPPSGATLALALLLPGLLSGCQQPHRPAKAPRPEVAERQVGAEPAPAPSYNVEATRAAKRALEQTLRRLAAAPGFALGHEDATAYGVGWVGDHDRSDIKDVCGDHAAVFGWDAFGIENGATSNGDGVAFDFMRDEMVRAYASGGLNTISWHVDNPVTGGDAWDTSDAVRHILPQGAYHDRFMEDLRLLADFLLTLRGHDNELLPLIFRPYHEHTGGWFWWGRATTSEADFRALFRLTADYLVHTRGLENLLFAFSPGGGEVASTADYLYGYPGDDYVDVLGLDYYYMADSEGLMNAARIAVQQARARGKVAAITEFGARGGLNQFGVDSEHWFTRQVLAPLELHPEVLEIAYALAWRNAREDHCFVSYPGHVGEQDFRSFCADPRVLLRRDVDALFATSPRTDGAAVPAN